MFTSGEERIVNFEECTWNSREELLTVAEVAKFLKVPPSWIYGQTRARGAARIPHFKIGKYLRFRLADVRAWIEGMRES